MSRNAIRRRRCVQGGFTLIELVVVIGIQGVLLSLLLPAIQAVREEARISNAEAVLRELGFEVFDYVWDDRICPGSLAEVVQVSCDAGPFCPSLAELTNPQEPYVFSYGLCRYEPCPFGAIDFVERGPEVPCENLPCITGEPKAADLVTNTLVRMHLCHKPVDGPDLLTPFRIPNAVTGADAIAAPQLATTLATSTAFGGALMLADAATDGDRASTKPGDFRSKLDRTVHLSWSSSHAGNSPPHRRRRIHCQAHRARAHEEGLPRAWYGP